MGSCDHGGVNPAGMTDPQREEAGPAVMPVMVLRDPARRQGTLRSPANPQTDHPDPSKEERLPCAVPSLKNPFSYRQVDFSDATEAAEIVLLADLLLGLLDKIEPVPVDNEDSGR